jgi:multidrug efflux pump
VLATVMSLILVLLGVISAQRLTVREYPKIDEPIVTVETGYKGASAEIVESQVTQPLEDSLSGIEGIDILSSISRSERSLITIRFKTSRDIDDAANDVRDRVGRVRDRLPDEIDEPITSKTEADAQPIIWISFTSDRHSSMQLTDSADRLVKDRLQSLPGISDVMIFGERRFSMRIWLDPARLAAYSVTPQDVEDALRAQNVDIPAGRIESRDREFTVLAETDLRSEREFNRLIIRQEAGYPVRLSDVGRAQLAPASTRSAFRIRGQEAVGIGIIKQSTANPLDVSKEVRAAVPVIRAALPQGMQLAVAYDTSIFIERSIFNVFGTIGEAVILVVLVIFVFLRSIRATLIPLVTIPVSLITTFALMLLMGFSINTLTLLAMVLAIGLVVDDAIVMLENIHRHIEEGRTPLQAALRGSREIGFAILAMTLTLAAVYAPMGFQTGRTGLLFTEFAWTLAGAVLVSGFVALTLSPMMGAKLLKSHEQHGGLYLFIERVIIGMTNGYRAMLRATLRWRWLVVLVFLGVGASGYLLFSTIRSELAPTEDRGVVLGFAMGPEGSTIDYMDSYARRMEKIFEGTGDVADFGAVAGFPTITQAIAFVVLKDWEQRSRGQLQIAGELGPKLFGLPGVLAFALNPPPLGQGFGDKPVSFVVLSSQSYAQLDEVMTNLVAEARKSPALANIDVDLKLNKPEIKVEVARDKLSDLGIDVGVLGRTLETMLGGRQVTRFKYEGKQYDVIVQTGDENRRNPGDMNQIYVRNKGGQMVPLSNLATIRESVAPKELNHFQKLRSSTLTATLNPGYSLEEGLNAIEQAAARVLPPSASTDYSGISREFKVSTASLYITFLLALAFIYLVLSAQFESFIDPLVIMLTVPLAMMGALLLLKLAGGTINVYSQIGLITLVGLITKHGILIVEFANQRREQGLDVFEAVVEAAALRLRPILMTTGAMVLGALPLAMATGAGAEARQQIGWVIVGGMTFGTLLTLFVVPAAYTLLTARKRLPMTAEEAAAE